MALPRWLEGSGLRGSNSKQEAEVALAPLDEIQRIEVEVARRVAAAREDVQRVENAARDQALLMIREAQEQSQREGQQDFEAMVAQARRESEALLDEAHRRAEALRQKGKSSMDSVIRDTMAIVLGVKEDTS